MFCGQYRISSNLVLLNPTRNITVSTSGSTKNLYDSLGITPKATQVDVKTAYYRMSMLYHPDKNKGCIEAAQKFRDITAAYEVLGNLKLRRKYDRGILDTEGLQYDREDDEELIKERQEEDAQTKFYKSRTSMHKAPTQTGRTPIYDFDEWSRAHYGVSFARKEAAKKRYNQKTEAIASDSTELKKEISIFCVILFIVSFFSLTYMEDYDVVSQNKVTNIAGNQPLDDNLVANTET